MQTRHPTWSIAWMRTRLPTRCIARTRTRHFTRSVTRMRHPTRSVTWVRTWHPTRSVARMQTWHPTRFNARTQTRHLTWRGTRTDGWIIRKLVREELTSFWTCRTFGHFVWIPDVERAIFRCASLGDRLGGERVIIRVEPQHDRFDFPLDFLWPQPPPGYGSVAPTMTETHVCPFPKHADVGGVILHRKRFAFSRYICPMDREVSTVPPIPPSIVQDDLMERLPLVAAAISFNIKVGADGRS